MTSPLALLSAHTAELDLSLCTQREGAIYFLVEKGEVVYIGQTTRLIARIGLHISGDKRTPIKGFDSVRWIRCEIGDLDAYEGALIRLIRPAYNRRAPYWTGRDNEVLAALGLPLHADEEANEKAWRAFAYTPRPHARKSYAAGRITRDRRQSQRARAQRLFAGIKTAYLEQRSAA